ncbi:MAG: hypothetical protein KDC54_19990 [Lewinella sp.]|nr:hypothetical protein [Lewinella sp.]
MNTHAPLQLWSWLVPFLFFAGWLSLGWWIAPDFGMSYDETFQQEYGRSVLQYANEHLHFTDHHFSNTPLMERQNRFHGPVYTTLAAWLNWQLDHTSFRSQVLLRHRLSFLFFWLGGLAVFWAGRQLTRRWAWGLVAALLLFLSPRLFGHAFFNPKDIPNLGLYALAGASLLWVIERPNGWRLAVHAVFSGLALAMRMTGIFLPLLTLFFLTWRYWSPRAWLTLAWQSAFYLVLGFATTTLCWPTLWDAPLLRFAEAFRSMSSFPWKGWMWVAGKRVLSTELPVWYLPVWLGVTIPLMYLWLGNWGIGRVMVSLWRRMRTRTLKAVSVHSLQVYAAAALFAAPLLLIMIRNPVIYNEWRHLYFIYPFFLVSAAYVAFLLWRQRSQVVPRLVLGLLVANLLFITYWQSRWHPNQYVYFNTLAGREQFLRYDMDYWGVSFKQGFEQLAKIDTRDSIRVIVSDFPGWLNEDYLPGDLKKRIHLSEPGEGVAADYYMTNYHYWHNWHQGFREHHDYFAYPEVWQLYVGRNPILGIYRMKE